MGVSYTKPHHPPNCSLTPVKCHEMSSERTTTQQRGDEWPSDHVLWTCLRGPKVFGTCTFYSSPQSGVSQLNSSESSIGGASLQGTNVKSSRASPFTSTWETALIPIYSVGAKCAVALKSLQVTYLMNMSSSSPNRFPLALQKQVPQKKKTEIVPMMSSASHWKL